MGTKFNSHQLYLCMRFAGIYKIFTEIGALCCTNLLHDGVTFFFNSDEFCVSKLLISARARQPNMTLYGFKIQSSDDGERDKRSSQEVHPRAFARPRRTRGASEIDFYRILPTKWDPILVKTSFFGEFLSEIPFWFFFVLLGNSVWTLSTRLPFLIPIFRVNPILPRGLCKF